MPDVLDTVKKWMGQLTGDVKRYLDNPSDKLTKFALGILCACLHQGYRGIKRTGLFLDNPVFLCSETSVTV